MAPLTDPEILNHYRTVLELRRFAGYVVWGQLATDWIRENLEDLTTRDLAEMMWQHVEAGGEIDRVAETRAEWSEYAWHYDLRLKIQGRPIYIETRLIVGSTPEDSTIHVVNVHEA